MDVQIIHFPETKIAAIEHFGSPALEHDTVRKLIAWKIENRLMDPLKYRSYGIHFTNPHTTPAQDHHVEFCLSVDFEIEKNTYSIVNKVIPGTRCAVARDIGSRANNKAVVYLMEKWLPQSGESLGDFPVFFHYVNVGPNVQPEEMVTDVYLPLK